MADARTCPQCGAELTPGALDGLCPKCIGKVTFGLDASGEPVAAPTGSQSAFRGSRALCPFSSLPAARERRIKGTSQKGLR